MDSWDEIDAEMVRSATEDIEAGVDVAPLLAAYVGDHPVFLAHLRPFAKGEYHDPLVELLALAMPLDADRLALSVSARVWSLDDPVVPVTEDGDLRQRALVCVFVDGSAGRPRERTVFHPYDLRDRAVVWSEPHEVGGGVGFVQSALTLAVRRRARLRSGLDEIRAQADRCLALGHRIYLAPAIFDRLDASARTR